MAEMNELLDQAIQECEGLTAEAESFADALTEMGRLSGDESDVLAGARATVSGLHDALAALKRRDGELDEREEEEQTQLERLDAALEEREAEVAECRQKLEQAVRELTSEKERIAEALRSAHEHGQEELEALRERFEALEQQAEDQLQRSEEATSRLEDAVRAAMDAAREAQAGLLDAIETAREESSSHVEALVESWEATADQVAARALALKAGVREALGQASEAVQHAFEEEVPAVLDEASGDLGTTLEAAAALADDQAQLGNAELQDLLQKQMQALQAMSNVMSRSHEMMTTLMRAVS